MIYQRAKGIAGEEAFGTERDVIDHTTTKTYAELYDWLEPGQLLDEPPPDWAEDWARASPDTFR